MENKDECLNWDENRSCCCMCDNAINLDCPDYENDDIRMDHLDGLAKILRLGKYKNKKED